MFAKKIEKLHLLMYQIQNDQCNVFSNCFCSDCFWHNFGQFLCHLTLFDFCSVFFLIFDYVCGIRRVCFMPFFAYVCTEHQRLFRTALSEISTLIITAHSGSRFRAILGLLILTPDQHCQRRVMSLRRVGLRH